MIKFIDINNGLVFDGSSYIKKAVCEKCGTEIVLNYQDKEITDCPTTILGKSCGGKLKYTMTGPHHIFWFENGQSTGIYNVKEI